MHRLKNDVLEAGLAVTAMRRANSAVQRLQILRNITSDYSIDTASAMLILTTLTSGVEREEGLIIMKSRMKANAVAGVVQLMGADSFSNVLRRVGPYPLFDRTSASGTYVVRLDKKQDRRVLVSLLQLATKLTSSNDKLKEKKEKISPSFLSIFVQPQGLRWWSPDGYPSRRRRRRRRRRKWRVENYLRKRAAERIASVPAALKWRSRCSASICSQQPAELEQIRLLRSRCVAHHARR